MGTQLPLAKKGYRTRPQFSAHVYCGQTAGWIKMPLGREVGLDQSNIVLDGDPGWMKMPLRTEVAQATLC